MPLVPGLRRDLRQPPTAPSMSETALLPYLALPLVPLDSLPKCETRGSLPLGPIRPHYQLWSV